MSSGRGQPSVPFITAEQMRQVDRAMVEEYGILLIQMMENAGRSLAQLARSRFLDGDPKGRCVMVLSGKGGNGGGGLVCARWLHNWGADVRVWLTAPTSQFTDVPRHQLTIIEHMGLPVEVAGDEVDLSPGDVIIDALIGYSLRGAPAGAAATLVCAANDHDAPILALDVPSGVDATTGEVHVPAIRAAATLTLAVPKEGLSVRTAKDCVGELYLADIGVPPEVYARSSLGLEVEPIFAESDVIRVW